MFDSDDKEDGEDDLLVDLFLFAETIKDLEAMNASMNALLNRFDDQKTRLLPQDELVSLIYRKTEEGSPLRRFVVDTYRWGAQCADALNETPKDLPREFLLEWSAALLREKDQWYEPRGVPHGVN